MGSPESEMQRESDETQHEVTVSDFYIGRYEVTQAEYENIMGENPSNFSGENLPVENVTWYDAIEYCNKLSEKEGLTPVYTIDGENVSWDKSANGYRLPTEAEWEYAARAGTLLGYPNWWATIPMPVASFLEEYDFSGKTIVPFCSHGGGGFGQSITDISKLAPNSKIGEGLSIHYSGGSSLESDISTWLSNNGIQEQ